MPFERVWDVGGYVISHLVRTYARTDTRAWEVMQRYTGRENGTIYLTAPCNAGTERIRKYGISGSVVRFASRYIPEDIFRIHRTLEILDKCFKRSLGRFAYAILQGRTSHEEAVRHMAHALNQLTYTGGYRVSAESLDRQIRRTERELADHEFEFNCDQPLWHRKRLWCSLRDYLKSPEFNPLFVEALRGADCPRATGWKKENSGVVSALKILDSNCPETYGTTRMFSGPGCLIRCSRMCQRHGICRAQFVPYMANCVQRVGLHHFIPSSWMLPLISCPECVRGPCAGYVHLAEA